MLGQIIVCIMLFGPGVLGNALAYHLSKKSGHRETLLLPFMGLPAAAVWYYLMAHGHGAQSLGNLCEGYILSAVAIMAGFGKIHLLDPRLKRPALSTCGLAVVLVLIAVALRAWMPSFPE